MSNSKFSQNSSEWIAKLDFKGLISGYDYASLAQTSTTDTYTFNTGGASGRTLATLTITYTDASKTTLSSWTIS